MREHANALAAYALYVHLGPGRSIRRLHDELTTRRKQLGLKRVPNERTLDRWSSDFHWQERIAELEQKAAQHLGNELAREQAEVLTRRRKLGLSLQQQGLHVLRSRSEKDWNVRDALNAVDRGSAMEKDASGVRADKGTDDLLERVAQRLEELTDDQLRRLT